MDTGQRAPIFPRNRVLHNTFRGNIFVSVNVVPSQRGPLIEIHVYEGGIFLPKRTRQNISIGGKIGPFDWDQRLQRKKN